LTSHSIYLRSACILPGQVGLLMEPFHEGWSHAERIESRAFDGMIRSAKWHFIRVHGTFTQRGFGTTEENAIHRALVRALKSINARFNVAEFDSLQVSRLAGFYVANVTMHARLIQQNAPLEAVAQGRMRNA
jgi:hypothetical protein